MSRMLTGESLRHEDVNKFSDKLLASIPKQLFDVRVHQHNAALIVHQNDTARRSFRRQAEQILCLLSRRYVYGNTDEAGAFAVFPRHAASTPAEPTHISIR